MIPFSSVCNVFVSLCIQRIRLLTGKTPLALPPPPSMCSTPAHDSTRPPDWNQRAFMCFDSRPRLEKAGGRRLRLWWSLQRREVWVVHLVAVVYSIRLINAAHLVCSQLAHSPRLVPLYLRKKCRLAVCCCHGNRVAMVCRPSDITPSSTESCRKATGPFIRLQSAMRSTLMLSTSKCKLNRCEISQLAEGHRGPLW